MRILFANDGIRDGGGVQSYLDVVVSGMKRLGHDVAFLHFDLRPEGAGFTGCAPIPFFGVQDEGLERAVARADAWAPDVCYSHNMRELRVERELIDRYPVVKFMHGYFGTCIGGQKTHLLPRPEPCSRRFGAACVALYLPRRCGQARLGKFVEHFRWTKEQKLLFPGYRAVVVASEHMRAEYVRNGVDEARVFVVPLFPPTASPAALAQPYAEGPLRVLFLGRMTKLKGGDLLIRAAAQAAKVAGRAVHLIMCGDGPVRAGWERLASELGVSADFRGWVTSAERDRLFLESDLLAVPSVWPEPFGLVGLEAGQAGVPAIAFDVGGIRQWLRDGVNGVLVPGAPPDYRLLAAALARLVERPAELVALRSGAVRIASEMSQDEHLRALEAVLAGAVRE